ncbi:hypothetical protein P3X46_028340 [Hevea brasiliensis]|uniref:Retrotransposon gag domain-containing protein n=1 Tax=Hevea brasiliensis TaxID=3981 RepID=A0ABQ9KNR9_HEVBR|nr:hypothetical protein P3X46_028340 [Hevea brasiliensis]
MLLQNVNSFILYMVFPTTLIGLLIQAEFASFIPPTKLGSDLMKIRQAERESLRDYISRFNAEAIQIENLNHEIAFEAIKNGSKNNRFVNSLIKNPTVDYEQLMELAKKYIRLDNERTALKEEWCMSQSSKRRHEKRRSDQRAYGSNVKTSRRDRYNSYTSLTKSRAQVLIWIQKNGQEIKWPQKMKLETLNQRDKKSTTASMMITNIPQMNVISRRMKSKDPSGKEISKDLLR